jgi:hypothetical protein
VSRPHSPWQWVAIGAGAALVVGGGLLTHFANVDRARVDDATVWSDGTIKRSSVTRSEALSLSAEADRKMDASIALYAIGGAAVVTGIVLWLTEPAGSQPGRADSGPGRLAGVGAAPFGDGAALSLSGWF